MSNQINVKDSERLHRTHRVAWRRVAWRRVASQSNCVDARRRASYIAAGRNTYRVQRWVDCHSCSQHFRPRALTFLPHCLSWSLAHPRKITMPSGVTPVGQGWTNARGLRGLGGPKPDPKIELELFSPEITYIVTCESVHVMTCCMLPYIHFCICTVIEITVIY